MSYKNPWWGDNSADETPYQGDAYSIDSSLYIEEDDDSVEDSSVDDCSDRNVVPDVPSPPPAHRVTVTRSKDVSPPSVPAPRSFGSTGYQPKVAAADVPDTASPPRSSPTRRALQDLSATVSEKLSKGTAKVSKNLSKHLSSLRSSLDRPKPVPTGRVEESAVKNVSNAPASPPINNVNKSPSRKSMTESMTKGISNLGKKAKSFRDEHLRAGEERAPKPVVETPAGPAFNVSDVHKSPPRKSLTESVTKSMSNLGKKAKSLRMEHQRTQSNLTEVSTQRDVASTRSGRSTSTGSNTDNSGFRRYSVKELIQSLGRPDVDLPPALERRVRDFKFAQGKRRERHGDNKPWGIYGLYAHLSEIRADLEWAEDAAWRRQRSEPYLSWSDFEKSRDKGLRNRPWFTYAMIALCTIMLIVTLGVNGWKVEPLHVNPLIGPSSETLVKVGARQTDLIVNEGQWFRLFTPLVLHAGLVHYFINMGALFFIGGAVEQSHGFASAAVLFVLPAVGGNILSAICLPQYISVGASGGIFGLIGGCLADISINWNLLFLKSTTDQESRWRHFMVLFWLAFDIVVNCVLGFTPFVDNFTHLGGFLYGLCCGLSTIERLAVGFFGLRSDKYSKAWGTFVRFFGLIASVLCIMITTVILVQSDGLTSPCNGCRYISCVPFPPRTDDKWWYCDDCDFVKADLFVDGAGTGLYREIDLTCPNGEIETIDITDDQLFKKDDVRKALPTYCRRHCEEVFMNSH